MSRWCHNRRLCKRRGGDTGVWRVWGQPDPLRCEDDHAMSVNWFDEKVLYRSWPTKRALPRASSTAWLAWLALGAGCLFLARLREPGRKAAAPLSPQPGKKLPFCHTISLFSPCLVTASTCNVSVHFIRTAGHRILCLEATFVQLKPHSNTTHKPHTFEATFVQLKPWPCPTRPWVGCRRSWARLRTGRAFGDRHATGRATRALDRRQGARDRLATRRE
eukprot:365334-Chlamydomonas_euryale.AAC.5